MKKPPSVVTSDQPFFDPGTSTSGLSSGVTVGGTGSSLGQTTGEAAQRVHLLEVAVTCGTLISPVQIFGLVPVLFRLPGSLGSQWWGTPAPVLLRLPVVVTQTSSKGCTGFPVTELLVNIAGLLVTVLVTECCWLWSAAGSGVYQLQIQCL